MQRSVGLSVILTLVTCGLFGLYWFVVLTDDVGKLSGDYQFTGGKHLLLTLVTCGLWGYVWAYQAAKRVGEAQHQRGYLAQDNSLLYIVLYFFGLGIIVHALVQSDVNRLV